MVAGAPPFYAAVDMAQREPFNEKEPIPGSFGAFVRRRRKALGMTQEQLADRLMDLSGKSEQSSISKIEVPGTKVPRPPQMELLSIALDVPLGDLYAAAGHPGHAELGRDSRSGGIVIRIAEDAPRYHLWRVLSKADNEFIESLLRGFEMEPRTPIDQSAEAQQEPEAETGTD